MDLDLVYQFLQIIPAMIVMFLALYLAKHAIRLNATNVYPLTGSILHQSVHYAQQ